MFRLIAIALRRLLYLFDTDLERYIYTISPPNLGLEIIVPGREREQGRFRGSRERVGRE